MRRLFCSSRVIFSAFLCISAVISLPAIAEEIVVDSQIRAATVYNDRATLTRSGKIEISAGAHTLIFKGIPLNIYTDSLRAQGASTADVVFGALEHKRDSSEDYIVPKEKELHAQIEKLEDEKKVHNAEKRALSTARKFLENIGKTASLRENEEIAKLELKPESWANAADGIAAKFAENIKAELALDIKVRDTQRKIQNLRNELNGLRTGQKQSFSVSLPLEVSRATTLSVDLIYQISNVSWQPMYDARLDVKSEKLELVQYGSVWQRTGEDWEDVKLTLSTAQPSRGAGIPDLQTHWISLYQPHRARKSKSFGARMEMAPAYIEAVEQQNEADLDRAIAMGGSAIPVPLESPGTRLEVPEIEEVTFQFAEVNTEGFVGEYVIPGPVDVKSDGTKAKVLIGSFETENTLEVQVKPQIDTNAYLVAKAELKGEAPILPGKVSLFRDGAYIGQSHTQMLRPGDETELSFGVDDNITVTRNKLVDKRSEAGVISKSNVQERGFVTRIKNLHKEPVSLAVLETIPAATDEKISVEVIKEKTTQGYKSDVDDVKGLLRWGVKLQAKKEAEVKLGWQVSWPKDANISGL